MSTLVKAIKAPARAKSKTGTKGDAGETAPLTEAAVRHYTAEEIETLRLLPCTARWLKKEAYARRVPFTGVAGKLTWRLDQILAISQMFDSAPIGARRTA
ncbi:hypothetical protein [Kitasatospora purpeofusca]|uniref:hypothetical protein n=1 Tax=Kitasatospora purpeofusca TaxID=67352 RepID=UPI002259793D|nr:hypothetical protein [Kitasatospora purpeofusca]MCX4752926.1 hypothetical protein [Kitasatospora purpeofusca]WSR32469.1 hypothetical protein OG715_16635 [Kitasatospora purpeofusca]